MAHIVTTVIRRCQNSPTAQQTFLPGRQADDALTGLLLSEDPSMSDINTPAPCCKAIVQCSQYQLTHKHTGTLLQSNRAVFTVSPDSSFTLQVRNLFRYNGKLGSSVNAVIDYELTNVAMLARLQ
jgi:hypothetical protein